MKKFIVLFLLVIPFLLVGCYRNTDLDTSTNTNQPSPPSQDLTEQPFDKTEEEQIYKKSYAVSNVNSLLVRAKPNISARVLGSLDKNDAVLILGKENSFYKTTYKEQTAYVYTNYCTILEVDTENERI